MVGYKIDHGISFKKNISPLKIKPFFNTKYHYVVPEFTKGQQFFLASQKPILEYLEAKSCGIETIPSLLGPFSFLMLGSGEFDRVSLIYKLLTCYESLFEKLNDRGVEWVYLHEPCLTLNLTQEQQQIFYKAYNYLLSHSSLHVGLISYFGSICQNWNSLDGLPFSSIHLDIVSAPEQLDFILSKNLESYLYLSLGVVDARNIWKNNLAHSLHYLEKASQKLGIDKIQVAPSSSLLFVPYDKNLEDFSSPAMKKIQHKLAFAKQKIEEIALLKKSLNQNIKSTKSVRNSSLNFEPVVNKLSQKVILKKSSFQKTLDKKIRKNNTQTRAKKQVLDNLPQNPLTVSSPLALISEINQNTKEIDSLQPQLELDLIALGEVDYYDRLNNFCESLSGFATTKSGWVQSFGLECYRPPILYSDVQPPNSSFLSEFTGENHKNPKKFKALLPTPSAILIQSFLRKDKTFTALLEEVSSEVHKTVLNLEKANITFIQWENPPLKNLYWENSQIDDTGLLEYNFLQQTIQSLAFCCYGLKDTTQVHIYSNSLFFLLQLDKLEVMDVCFLKIAKNTTFKNIAKKVQYLIKKNINARISLELDSIILKNEDFRVTDLLKTFEWMNNLLKYKQIWVSFKGTAANQRWLKPYTKHFTQKL